MNVKLFLSDLESSSSTGWAGRELVNISMLLWKALDRVLGTGKSEMEVICESSDTLLLATIALLSASTSGSSTLDLTIRSCFRTSAEIRTEIDLNSKWTGFSS